MQIILREDVPHLGRRGDVVKVADGYARNYLLPKRLAYLVTPGISKQIETEGRARTAREARERRDAESLAQQLRDVQVLRLFRKAGETGVFYGSVTAADIAEALGTRGFTVDKRNVRLDDPIKKPGTYRVPVHVYRDVNVELVVEVEPEDAAATP